MKMRLHTSGVLRMELFTGMISMEGLYKPHRDQGSGPHISMLMDSAVIQCL